MDSTKLFKTARTTEQTQLYRPGSVLDQSLLSQNYTASRILSPRINQSMVQIQQLGYGRPIPAQIVPVVQAPTVRGPTVEQVYVYCPVCKRDFSNSEVDFHARLHTAAGNYNFFIPNAGRSAVGAPANAVAKDMDKTKVTMDGSQSSVSTSSGVQYPMIEPLQFWTNQLADSAKNDVFIFKDNKNFDAVDKSLFQELKKKTVSYIDSQAQTYRKPPLQYESNQTNLYNCLDNAVNAKNGPKFSFADLTKNNKIITPKRQLDDWEIMQKNIAETYVQPRSQVPATASGVTPGVTKV